MQSRQPISVSFSTVGSWPRASGDTVVANACGKLELDVAAPLSPVPPPSSGATAKVAGTKSASHLLDSVLLAVTGGVCGILLAWWSVRLFEGFVQAANTRKR